MNKKRENFDFIFDKLIYLRTMEGFRGYSNGQLDEKSLECIISTIDVMKRKLTNLSVAYKRELTKIRGEKNE